MVTVEDECLQRYKKIDSSTLIFKGILYKVKFALEIVELLGMVICQKYPKRLYTTSLSK